MPACHHLIVFHGKSRFAPRVISAAGISEILATGPPVARGAPLAGARRTPATPGNNLSGNRPVAGRFPDPCWRVRRFRSLGARIILFSHREFVGGWSRFPVKRHLPSPRNLNSIIPASASREPSRNHGRLLVQLGRNRSPSRLMPFRQDKPRWRKQERSKVACGQDA